MTKRKKTTKTAQHLKASNEPLRLPFIEHLLELRRRLSFVAISILAWSGAAYAVQQTIVEWLLKPSHGEKFIYTTVGGGQDFLFRVCLYTGLVMSVPVIIYQILRYLQPLIGRHPTRFILGCSTISGVLAISGILFGYYLGLPAALGSLLNQFRTADISALITIQSYLSFVLIYLAGSSLMFQVPLVMFFINRIRPLKIRTLLKQERWVVAISIVISAAINPSPRIADLAILAFPMMLSYQIGILIVWLNNRRGNRSHKVQDLLAQDKAAQNERLGRLKTVEYVWQQSELNASLAKRPNLKPLAASDEAFVRKKSPSQPSTTPKHAVKQSVPTSKQQAHPSAAAGRSQKYANGYVDMRRSPSSRRASIY